MSVCSKIPCCYRVKQIYTYPAGDNRNHKVNIDHFDVQSVIQSNVNEPIYTSEK